MTLGHLNSHLIIFPSFYSLPLSSPPCTLKFLSIRGLHQFLPGKHKTKNKHHPNKQKIIMVDIIGSRIISSILPSVISENIEVATFFALLSYVLFLINWVVTTDWVEKVRYEVAFCQSDTAICFQPYFSLKQLFTAASVFRGDMCNWR